MSTATKSTKSAADVKSLNITNKPEMRDALARIAELKEIERAGAAAERERKALEADLRADMGDAETLIVRGNVVAKLSSQRNAHVYDYAMLLEAFPEAYDAVHSLKPYRFLTVL